MWLYKSVDKVGSTFFYRNLLKIFATRRTITEAHLPVNFTIFHRRMSSNQPAWPVCTTVVWFHTHCWHSCSRSSHKTIPSLREWLVTQPWTLRCCVIHLSIGVTQVFIMIAGIGCIVKRKVAKWLRLLKSMFQDVPQRHIILAAC